MVERVGATGGRLCMWVAHLLKNHDPQLTISVSAASAKPLFTGVQSYFLSSLYLVNRKVEKPPTFTFTVYLFCPIQRRLVEKWEKVIDKKAQVLK